MVQVVLQVEANKKYMLHCMVFDTAGKPVGSLLSAEFTATPTGLTDQTGNSGIYFDRYRKSRKTPIH